MVNKSDNATAPAPPEDGKNRRPGPPEDGTTRQPAPTREERLAAELRRNLLKRKAQSRGRAVDSGKDGEDGGAGA